DALAGIDERMNHMASDIAGAAGDQDRHARGPLISPGVAGSSVGNIRLRTCMHVLATGDKSRENRSLPLRERVRGYSRKIGRQASGLPHPARTPPRALHARHALPQGERVLRPRGTSLRSASGVAHITTMRLSPHSPCHTARTIDPGAFARFTID